MSNTEKPIRLRDVFRRGFWGNYILVLLVTCWMPLLTHHARMVDGEGKLISESFTKVRVYESYWALLHGGGRWQAMAVGVHLGLCFLMCAGVWYLVLRTGQKAAAEENQSPKND